MAHHLEGKTVGDCGGVGTMKVEKHTYESPSVERVVANVRAGVRTKEDLEFCGCPVCREALKILGMVRI